MLDFVGLAIEATILKIDDAKNEVEFDVEIKCYLEIPNVNYGNNLRYMNKNEIQSLIEPDIRFINTTGPWIEISKPIYLCENNYVIINYNWRIVAVQEFDLKKFPFDDQNIYLTFVVQNTANLYEFPPDIVENDFERLIIRNKDFNYYLLNSIKSDVYIDTYNKYDSYLTCSVYYFRLSCKRLINFNIYKTLFLDFLLIIISFFVKLILNLNSRILIDMLIFIALIIVNSGLKFEYRQITLVDKFIFLSYIIIVLDTIKNIILKKNYENNFEMIQTIDVILFFFSFVIFISSRIMLFIMSKESIHQIVSDNKIQRLSSVSALYNDY